jgi:hypothetical protein
MKPPRRCARACGREGGTGSAVALTFFLLQYLGLFIGRGEMAVLVLKEFEAAPLANVQAARRQQEHRQRRQHRQPKQPFFDAGFHVERPD